MIGKCEGCSKKEHSQDKLHGKGNRVLIEISMSQGNRKLRCTVCSTERTHYVSGK